jgi:malonyl-CoA O-methyltransferase
MNLKNLASHRIARSFDRAAQSYDAAAPVQAQIARHLIEKAMRSAPPVVHRMLDIGCGTGLVAKAAAQQWPDGALTALDAAPAMLKEAKRKIPSLRVIEGDMSERQFGPEFDLIFSSMALHWLPDPRQALEQWRGWLKPQGRLFASLLIEGSFREWRDHCAAEGLADGLWIFPSVGFAASFDCEEQSIHMMYSSAAEFLRRLKSTGAGTPRSDHRPLDTVCMRRLLARAPQPFPVTYRVLYIAMPFSI